jgi:hypothetical protein
MRDQLQAPPEVSAVAVALGVSLRAMIAAVPGSPHKPTPLARLLGLSRVTTSKLLSALRRDDPAELLGVIPGPESLRIAASGAAELGVDAALVEGATKAIDEFAALIGDGFGTRDALHAAIVGRSGTLRSKVEESARAEVFKGLRQIIGVEANTWLTSMLFMPGTPEEVVAVTTIHGALGMRRLRRETPVYFTFGPPYHDPANDAVPSPSQVSLLDYCTNEPAALETKVVGEQLRYRLVDGPVGKHAVSDMLVVSHNAQGSRKYATPGSPLRGVSLFVDIPARMLVCDAIVHRDVFPDREPELMVFNPGARGPANPNDPTRGVDRISVTEAVTQRPADERRFVVPHVPNYAAMVARVCENLGRSAEEFRVFRLTMSYPITSFQYVIAFRAPEKPG